MQMQTCREKHQCMEEKLQSHAEELRGEGCVIQGSPEKQNQEDVCAYIYILTIKGIYDLF